MCGDSAHYAHPKQTRMQAVVCFNQYISKNAAICSPYAKAYDLICERHERQEILTDLRDREGKKKR